VTTRHEFLQQLHQLLAPRGYLEIGVADGRSLALSRSPTVAVDPAFVVSEPVHCDLDLVKSTSDDFFARPEPVAHLPGGNVDLAFIDGMHLFEFALRDFMGVERLSHPGTVVMIDDMLPRNHREASRIRRTTAWTGDVFKLRPVLEKYRPDLTLVSVDTRPTGVMLVLGLDSANTVLKEAYDAIVAEWVTEDPQVVPPEVLKRTIARAPDEVLQAGFWPWLVSRRGRPVGRPDSAAVARRLRDELDGRDGRSNPPGPTTVAGHVAGWARTVRTVAKPRTRVRRWQRSRERRRTEGRPG